MTSQPGKQTITIHMLTNISRSKGNQTMQFNQLLEYNKNNVVHKKSYMKCSGDTIRRPNLLLKYKIEYISGSIV